MRALEAYQTHAFVRLGLALASILVFTSISLAQEATPGGKDAPAGPKKVNERRAEPATASAPDPFEGASVEKMGAQCVTLITEAGEIEIEILAEAAPETARNFLNLAATGAFNTTTFSRIVRDFVVQGGSLATSQNINPALVARSTRTIPDEPNQVKHERGIVSMARPDTPNGATTNFFILVGAASHLDGKFAAFGRVKRGIEVVDAMNRAPAEGEKPEKPVRITRAVVTACVTPGTER